MRIAGSLSASCHDGDSHMMSGLVSITLDMSGSSYVCALKVNANLLGEVFDLIRCPACRPCLRSHIPLNASHPVSRIPERLRVGGVMLGVTQCGMGNETVD